MCVWVIFNASFCSSLTFLKMKRNHFRMNHWKQQWADKSRQYEIHSIWIGWIAEYHSGEIFRRHLVSTANSFIGSIHSILILCPQINTETKIELNFWFDCYFKFKSCWLKWNEKSGHINNKWPNLVRNIQSLGALWKVHVGSTGAKWRSFKLN